jgi:hypothetical protein
LHELELVFLRIQPAQERFCRLVDVADEGAVVLG